jgi:arsenite-transporting ATPase
MGIKSVIHLSNTHQLAMFSGKGGVGKTTLSCAFARQWAQQFPTERILLISTDPAHSLGDVLQMPVTDTPRPATDLANLQVRALDASALLETFKQAYGHALELLVERGSVVEGADLAPVWDLDWPGLDELMGILEIQRLLRDADADRVVVDMAPSGHALNLFELMDFLDQFLGALALFQEKHRVVSQRFTGTYTPDEADAFLAAMNADLAAGRQLLQDAARTTCLIVAIAEPMSWLETRRFLEALTQLSIPVGGIIVNHLLDKPRADVERGDRRLEQQEILTRYFEIAGSLPVFAVPEQEQEPVGHLALDRLMAAVVPAPRMANLVAEQDEGIRLYPPPIPPLCADFISAGRRLILVGGKGGVGKTTVAAAIAWAMADRHPEHRVLVISIDPAHSLGDALGYPLGHRLTAIRENLMAQEVDATQVLDQFREEYLWELAAMISGDQENEGLQLAYGPQAWRQIAAQALPGIDEMLALLTVMERLESQEQDLIILDTAPTGHLLRFLEMPSALSDWLAWIFKLWLKYQNVVGHTEFMGRLRTLRQRVVQAQKKLKDSQHTEFIGVLQAQEAIAAETRRLTAALERLGVAQPYLIHNRYQPGQTLRADWAQKQTVVRLPNLPRAIAPLEQIQIAASLLVEEK